MQVSKTRHKIGQRFSRLSLPALLGLGALAAMAIALSACGGGGNSGKAAASAGSGSQSATVENVKLIVKTDEEHAKKGPEGKWHDAYLPADFSVKAGATVHVTVSNYDEAPHSFNAPDLGANAMIAAGSESKPTKTTFTFHAPQKAGRYAWFCAMPCDPWAMARNGYMKGYVTVT
jgi:plastocyanin